MTGATTHPQPSAVDPDERGRLTISPLVLRKIAEHTVDLTPGTLPARRTVAGVGLGSTGASAKAIITGQLVDMRVELALRYPGPVRSTVDQLRSRIGDEVRRITGYQVGSIAVTVTALLPEPSPGLR
ncbi:MAG: Asp23/Gls24 family envelope stress response protein [Pseudonocardiaceae bacterium]